MHTRQEFGNVMSPYISCGTKIPHLPFNVPPDVSFLALRIILTFDRCLFLFVVEASDAASVLIVNNTVVVCKNMSKLVRAPIVE